MSDMSTPQDPQPAQSATEPAIPLSWFGSDQAREWIESCFDEWDNLTSAEQQRYDGWVGGYILAVLGDGPSHAYYGRVVAAASDEERSNG